MQIWLKCIKQGDKFVKKGYCNFVNDMIQYDYNLCWGDIAQHLLNKLKMEENQNEDF